MEINLRTNSLIAWDAFALTIMATFAFGDSWNPPRLVRVEVQSLAVESEIVQSEIVQSEVAESRVVDSEVIGSGPNGQADSEVGVMNWSPPTWISEEHLLLRDIDYLLVSSGNRELVVPYTAGDGNELMISATEWSAELGHRTVAVSLKSAEGVDWLEHADEEELGDIRSIELPDHVDPRAIEALHRLALVNGNVAISVNSWSTLHDILPLFEPVALFVGDSDESDARAAAHKILTNQSQLQTLSISAKNAGSLDFLPTLPRLCHLLIDDWNVEAAGPLPAGITGLKWLTVEFGDAVIDLSSLRDVPSGLEELSLTSSSLTDLSGLTHMTELSALHLTIGERDRIDLTDLDNLKKLRWLSIPRSTARDQFPRMMRTHPDLEILELARAENVIDLAPLGELKQLEVLVLNGTHNQVEVLRNLRSLRFIGVPQKILEESPEQLARLRKALPDALIVQAEPLCLGSGWILLLVPASAFFWFLAERTRRGIAMKLLGGIRRTTS